MIGSLSTAQKAVGAVVVILAVVGWWLAISNGQRTSGLEDSLALAETEKDQLTEQLSAAQAELEAAQAEVAQVAEGAKQLDELTAEITSSEQRLAEIAELVNDGETKLSGLTENVAAAETELATLQEQSEVYERLLEGGPNQFLTASASVNVRAQPSTDSEVLVTLPEDFTVEVFEVVEGGEWFKIGGVGYVFHDLLKPSEGETEPSAN